MRPTFRLFVESDPAHKRKKQIVLKDPFGERWVLADNLLAHRASRMLLPIRKALMAGMGWLREDAASYVQSVHPDVQFDLGAL